MGYPVGPLLAALADRILHNLDLIEAKAPKWGTPEQDQPPYSDTQLLISLLGVLIPASAIVRSITVDAFNAGLEPGTT
jgi:hypothetical protein